jgi:hypothetical protein
MSKRSVPIGSPRVNLRLKKLRVEEDGPAKENLLKVSRPAIAAMSTHVQELETAEFLELELNCSNSVNESTKSPTNPQFNALLQGKSDCAPNGAAVVNSMLLTRRCA